MHIVRLYVQRLRDHTRVLLLGFDVDDVDLALLYNDSNEMEPDIHVPCILTAERRIRQS